MNFNTTNMLSKVWRLFFLYEVYEVLPHFHYKNGNFTVFALQKQHGKGNDQPKGGQTT